MLTAHPEDNQGGPFYCCKIALVQSSNLSGVVDINAQTAGRGAETRHRHHLPRQRVEEACPNRGANVADSDGEASWPPNQCRVI